MLTVKQVATRLTLSLSKTYQLLDSGQLEHHRMGTAIRISEEQLDAYLEKTIWGRTAQVVRHPHPRLKHLKL